MKTAILECVVFGAAMVSWLGWTLYTFATNTGVL